MSASSPWASPAKPTLKLFSPETPGGSGTPPEESPDQTLSEFWVNVFQVLVCGPRGHDAKTIGLFQDSIDYWKQFTGDPPLRLIDDFVAAKFVEGLQALPGRKSETASTWTVKKHCVNIQQILNFAGPKTAEKEGRKNRGLIPLPPLLEFPRPDEEAPEGDFSLTEVYALIAAAKDAGRPRGWTLEVTPADWWRSFFVVAAHTGLRLGALMRLRYQDLGTDLIGPYITVWARSSKRRKGRRQHLTQEAHTAIEAIRSAREFIFEWPNWINNPRWHRRCFDQIVAKAGVKRIYGRAFHGFRKFYGTALADGEDGMHDAQIGLGHSSQATTRASYVNKFTQHKQVARAHKKLPSLHGDRQLPLEGFDD